MMPINQSVTYLNALTKQNISGYLQKKRHTLKLLISDLITKCIIQESTPDWREPENSG